ncbi:FMN-linked oxidoreductase [Anaeromyces robustus]|uniref:FMN-linked oxidoreductase n=1 Tax=Anaeromyces robustus TaxID=1754192 RepID=A0A1Y1XFB0_9FUNG|nr:FMN-linked oxidoreductase [Anaeromyces robustus]|eukprot:ORX84435.1 FMN-linked oxidoreductase [Anaeromyces robustus]
MKNNKKKKETMIKKTIDFENKVILAPMVRIGSFPMRYLSLKYGADYVCTCEIVDKRIIKSTRIVNKKLGTIDYMNKDRIEFRTTDYEKGKVILQLGTCDPDLALQAAKHVEQDVAAIDVNCGCPKRFSVIGGMGAALLANPDKIIAILTNLVNNLSIPVTCKIRLLNTYEETIDLVKRIEATGVAAITVHCRDAVKIPVIANGDIFCYDDMEKIKKISNINSFMIARAAQSNPSIFRRDGLLPKLQIVKEYSKLCAKYDMPYQNAKYALLCIWQDHQDNIGYSLVKSKSIHDICKGVGEEEYYYQVLKERNEKEIELSEETRAKQEETYADQCPYIPRAPYIPKNLKHALDESDDKGGKVDNENKKDEKIVVKGDEGKENVHVEVNGNNENNNEVTKEKKSIIDESKIITEPNSQESEKNKHKKIKLS